MLGCVYMFESEGTQSGEERTVSVLVRRAIEASINERSGMHYQELTEAANPKPVFALLFADADKKSLFEILFEAALKLCGLRATSVHALTESHETESAADAGKAELGYIDLERGYAILIPKLPRQLQD